MYISSLVPPTAHDHWPIAHNPHATTLAQRPTTNDLASQPVGLPTTSGPSLWDYAWHRVPASETTHDPPTQQPPMIQNARATIHDSHPTSYDLQVTAYSSE